MKKKEQFVAIILVNYKNVAITEQCLISLNKVSYTSYRIYVVDNGSSADCINQLRLLCEKYNAILIQSNLNLGFAGGNNIGIKQALQDNAEYILLLNNDTIVEPDFLFYLIQSANEDKRIGIVTALTMHYPEKNKIWYAGGEIDYRRQRAIHYGIGEAISEQYVEKKDVSFVSGCCMLLSRTALFKVGMLPEDYFMYYEDMDYCINMFQHGYRMVYQPKARIYHCVSASGGGEASPFYIEWSNRSRRKMVKKYNELFSRDKIVCEIIEFLRVVSKSPCLESFKAYINSWR